MGTLQTLISLVVLIFVLSVIVQAVQDVLKSFLDTKASTLEGIINQFMGKHLNLSQVQDALKERGLDITALDHFNKDEFRTLLDGIAFDGTQLQGIVAKGQATLEEAKEIQLERAEPEYPRRWQGILHGTRHCCFRV